MYCRRRGKISKNPDTVRESVPSCINQFSLLRIKLEVGSTAHKEFGSPARGGVGGCLDDKKQRGTLPWRVWGGGKARRQRLKGLGSKVIKDSKVKGEWTQICCPFI